MRVQWICRPWRLAYLGQGDIGHNDGVHGTGGSTEGLVLVAMRVVLVLVHLTILRDVVPGHGALANADVALGGHGGGLGAKVPAALRSVWSANCTIWSMSLLRSVAARVGKYRHAQSGDNVTRGTQVGYEGRGYIHHPAIRKAPDMTPRRTCSDSSQNPGSHQSQWPVRIRT